MRLDQPQSQQPPFRTSKVPSARQSSFLETDGLEFERKLIKDRRFSAILVIETIQTLPEGSKARTSVSLIYRDAQGRTRRDRMPAEVSPAEIGTKTPHLTTINDPIAGFSYVLEHGASTARRSIFSLQPEEDSSVSVMIVKNSASPDKGAGSSQMLPVPTSSDRQHKLQSAVGFCEPKREHLGERVIEGFTAEGTRTTMSIPSGSIGNDRPVETVVERWYSPDLKTVVLIERTDPRLGKSVFRLSSIKRGDPAAALFRVPSEFKIISQ